MNDREELKRHLAQERPLTDDYPPLRGSVGVDMNEVIYTKGDFRGLPEKKRRYLDSEINCAINSHDFHEKHGHTNWYRRWFVEKQVRRYSEEAVRSYIENAPLKYKKSLEHFLAGDNPPKDSRRNS